MENKIPLFWCSNKKIGDEVIIYDSKTGKRYKGKITELSPHPKVVCKAEPAASGAYTFRRGNKWGTSNIWIEEAFNF